MPGFEDDNFNASGKRRDRNKKVIGIAKKAAVASTPIGLTAQLADAATKGKVSSQVRETWNIDGFDNASGEGRKKTLTTAQGAMIGFAALIIATGLVWGITKLTKKA